MDEEYNYDGDKENSGLPNPSYVSGLSDSVCFWFLSFFSL